QHGQEGAEEEPCAQRAEQGSHQVCLRRGRILSAGRRRQEVEGNRRARRSTKANGSSVRGLVTYSTQPAARACSMLYVMAWAETATIGMSRVAESCLSCLARVRPSMPGSCRSIRIRSG